MADEYCMRNVIRWSLLFNRFIGYINIRCERCFYIPTKITEASNKMYFNFDELELVMEEVFIDGTSTIYFAVNLIDK